MALFSSVVPHPFGIHRVWMATVRPVSRGQCPLPVCIYVLTLPVLSPLKTSHFPTVPPYSALLLTSLSVLFLLVTFSPLSVKLPCFSPPQWAPVVRRSRGFAVTRQNNPPSIQVI